MLIHHLRNATTIVSIGDRRLLIDPMLSPPGVMPGFKMFGGGRRNNPLVPLPPDTDAALEAVTDVLITHEHPDHLDRAGLEWVKARGLPVWANGIDAPNLMRKGLVVHPLHDGALGMQVEVIRTKHGRGLIGWILGPVAGYYLAHPDEPSLYIIGDSIRTNSVMEAIERLRPDVVVAPAGAANVGIGGDILFSLDEIVEVVKSAPGQVVLNHLEALDHCPITRTELRERMVSEGLSERVHIPADGEALSFARSRSSSHVAPMPIVNERPGLQKWFTAKLAGT